ncbi:gephyrin-like molybdotransferase receptor GlpR [Streptomyces sp. PR69]|uniref:divisome protein SepX/GlpR n=1 Tax=Streptomyces sp. PR69 TaxID=2984950 RepID=UPI0022647DE8|nr:gephyrin-like molybdotransferase receptor GlpR [Streptomyces sp. PR69]
MSSSGLIYAVIVGAWAAYLVPMWLRRQDELNEARPTERFSTAIRLLSGRAAMERRYAKELRGRTAEPEGRETPDADPDALTEAQGSVDVRAFAAPEGRAEGRTEGRAQARNGLPERRPGRPPGPRARPRLNGAAAERARRSKVLARRRRTTVILFLAFSLGAIVAAVGGVGFLWAPGIPAVLLSTYIVHLRAQERRRFEFTMDRRRAEAAAQRLRESRRPRRQQEAAAQTAAPPDEDPEPHPAPEPAPALSPQEAGRRALVEQTDHAEWLDQQRDRGPARGDSWEPVPVPLPTYVTAPVAPRATSGVEVGDPETWSAARSSPADPTPAPPRRPRPDRSRTPLFDQYADDDRPRAANE